MTDSQLGVAVVGLGGAVATTAVAGIELIRLGLAACGAYGSQLGFQFGGEAAMREQLTAFHLAEGRRLGFDEPVEALTGARLSGASLA